MPSQALIDAMVAGQPAPLTNRPEQSRLLLSMLPGNAPTLSPEEEALHNMSPIDALKFNRDLQNRRQYSPDEAAANRAQTLTDLGYSTPLVGQGMSAYDAYKYGKEAATQAGAGNMQDARKNALLGELSALGAVTGLPFGRTAAQVAKNAPDTLAAIMAYHGSPHDFEQFKLDKIGTGEGAQAYGHGFYFAEHPDTAKYYHQTLSNVRSSERIPTVQYTEQQLRDMAAKESEKTRAENLIYMADQMKGGKSFTDVVRSIPEPPLLHTFGDNIIQRPGGLYHTELDVEPHQLLDWDKPLSEQSEKIQKVVESIAKERADNYYHQKWSDFEDAFKYESEFKPSGEMLRYYTGNNRETSRKLLEAGIPGIKYLDQGSRGSGQGTSNYVIFDDKLVKVLDKDGVPVLPMDPASRMVRAREMGFAEEPFYRGEASGKSYQGGAAHFSRDPEVASGFAKRGGQPIPGEYRLNLRNTFSDVAPMTASQYGRLVEVAAARDPKLAADLAETIAPGKGVDWFLNFARARPDFIVAESGDLVRHAIERGSSDPIGLFRAAGYDALDSGRDVRKIGAQGIRSKDARFDPSKASSSDIMATLAGASLFPAWMLSQDFTSRRD